LLAKISVTARASPFSFASGEAMEGPLDRLCECSRNLELVLTAVWRAYASPGEDEFPTVLKLMRQYYLIKYRQFAPETKQLVGMKVVLQESEKALLRARRRARLKPSRHGSAHACGFHACTEFIDWVTAELDGSQHRRFVQWASDPTDLEAHMVKQTTDLRRLGGPTEAGFVVRDKAIETRWTKLVPWLEEKSSRATGIGRLIAGIKIEIAHVEESDFANLAAGFMLPTGTAPLRAVSKKRGRNPLTESEKTKRLSAAKRVFQAWKTSGLDKRTYCERENLVYKSKTSNAVTTAASRIRSAKQNCNEG
jgi:hypothetical protein